MPENKEPQSSSKKKNEEESCKDYSKYALTSFKKMNNYRKNNHLCDVIFNVGGENFPAHRIVLASSSDYFDAMFSNGMAESAQNIVELKSISPEVMEALLEFVYTGQVKVSMDNVQDLLPAASLIQLEGIKDACSKFLFGEIDSSNVLGIYRFAEIHNCSELELFAKNFTAYNFETVIEFEEFSFLETEELIDLISREDLNVNSEEVVYNAIIKWVYHAPETRSEYLPNLLKFIRLSLVSVHFLTDVVDKEPLIRKSLECRDILDEAKRFHLRPDLRTEMKDSHFRQRDSGDEYLVVIGGFGSDQSPSDSVEMLNPRTKEWSELPSLPIKYRYVAACAMGTCIYVIGGFDGRERLDTVGVLDLTLKEGWRWLAPMHYKRGLSVACAHRGLIYVCGGFDGQTRLRSLEVYHSKIDEWRLLEEMITPREGAGLVIVDQNLYCLGGYDGYHLLNSMETYDLQTGTWSSCSPMYMRRSGAGCAVLNDSIYVCGGYGGAEGFGAFHLDSVEVYNTRTKQWTLATSLNSPRCYVGACSLAGKIYVAAGYNGISLLNDVESFDPIENTWKIEENCQMFHERCDTGMCVVRFPSNVAIEFLNKSAKKNSMNHATNTVVPSTTEASSSTINLNASPSSISNTTPGARTNRANENSRSFNIQTRPFQMNNGSLSAAPSITLYPISSILRPPVTSFNHQIGSPSVISNPNNNNISSTNNTNFISNPVDYPENNTSSTTQDINSTFPRILYPSRVSSQTSTNNTNWPHESSESRRPEVSVQDSESSAHGDINRIIDQYILENSRSNEPSTSKNNNQQKMNNSTLLNNSLYGLGSSSLAKARICSTKPQSRNESKISWLLSSQNNRSLKAKNKHVFREMIFKHPTNEQPQQGPSRTCPHNVLDAESDLNDNINEDDFFAEEEVDGQASHLNDDQGDDEDQCNLNTPRLEENMKDNPYDLLVYSDQDEYDVDNREMTKDRRVFTKRKKDAVISEDNDDDTDTDVTENRVNTNDNNNRKRRTNETLHRSCSSLSSTTTSSSSASFSDEISKDHEDSTIILNNPHNKNSTSVQYSPSKIVLIKDPSNSCSGSMCNGSVSLIKRTGNNVSSLDTLIQPDVIGIAPISSCNNASIMNNETPSSVNVSEIQTCLRNDINHVINNFSDNISLNFSDGGTDENFVSSTIPRIPAMGCELNPAASYGAENLDSRPSQNATTTLPSINNGEIVHEDNDEDEEISDQNNHPNILNNDEPRTDGEGQEEVENNSD